MPRPRKSAATLKLSGAFAKNRDRTRTDILVDGPIGPWRVGSTDPKAVWTELVSSAPRGILTSADRCAVELLTLLIVEARKKPEAITAAKASAISSLLAKLGLTPVARLQLVAPEPQLEPNPFDEFVVRPRAAGAPR